MHLALYRKYRSQTFSDLVGQAHVVKTLQNALASGRIAHSYLFVGPRGTGKTSTARLLAKALNCERGPAPEPCNECVFCREITEGRSLDVIEMDAASESGVADVRERIVDVSEYRPNAARYKVFIIDEVHDLSRQAFDALLKTIEEPPPHVVFILATTEAHKVPPTIQSRCQRYEFHRASQTDIATRIRHVARAEGVEIEPDAVAAMARLADGGYRDALTLLEQAIVATGGRITLQDVYDQLGLVGTDAVDQLLLAVRDRDPARIMTTVEGLVRAGRDPRLILESIGRRLADLTRAAYGVDLEEERDSSFEAVTRETAARIGRSELLRLRAAVADAMVDLREVTLPRLWLESKLLAWALDESSQVSIAAIPAREALSPVFGPPPSPPAQELPRQAIPETRPEPLASDSDPWQGVVQKLSAVSKSAATHLKRSRLVSIEGFRVVVELERQVDREFVEKEKVRSSIREAWEACRGPGDWQFEFRTPDARAPSPSPEPTAVELSLEGERLAQVGLQVFDPVLLKPESAGDPDST